MTPKTHPPQTLVFVFLVQLFYVVPIYAMCMSMTYFTYLPFVAQVGVSRTRPKRGAQSSQHAVVATTLLTPHHTTTTLTS